MNEQKQIFTTSQIAKKCGIHPNTVRIYEEWGYLSRAPRMTNNYRQFDETHYLQLRFVLLLLQWPYPGGKQAALDAVYSLAKGDRKEALQKSRDYLKQVECEIERCQKVCHLVDNWAADIKKENILQTYTAKQAAQELDVSLDALRNWERNGLVRIEKHPSSKRRIYYAQDLDRLSVIRMLRKAGYSLMAILRMLNRLERGHPLSPSQNLEVPGENEDILTVADQWMTNLELTEKRVRSAIILLEQSSLH